MPLRIYNGNVPLHFITLLCFGPLKEVEGLPQKYHWQQKVSRNFIWRFKIKRIKCVDVRDSFVSFFHFSLVLVKDISFQITCNIFRTHIRKKREKKSSWNIFFAFNRTELGGSKGKNISFFLRKAINIDLSVCQFHFHSLCLTTWFLHDQRIKLHAYQFEDFSFMF